MAATRPLVNSISGYLAELKISSSDAKLKEALDKKNYYELLLLDKSADDKEIKKAYTTLARLVHPDKVSAKEKDTAEEIFKHLSESYAILSDKTQKIDYDRQLNALSPNVSAQSEHASYSPNDFTSQFDESKEDDNYKPFADVQSDSDMDSGDEKEYSPDQKTKDTKENYSHSRNSFFSKGAAAAATAAAHSVKPVDPTPDTKNSLFILVRMDDWVAYKINDFKDAKMSDLIDYLNQPHDMTLAFKNFAEALKEYDPQANNQTHFLVKVQLDTSGLDSKATNQIDYFAKIITLENIEWIVGMTGKENQASLNPNFKNEVLKNANNQNKY